MTDFPETDQPREQALQAAIQDLAATAVDCKASDEKLVAATGAERQVPIDMERMLNAVHVPNDAGEYEAVLRALLERIPDGWGRWIGCGLGWYPILARLERRLRQIDPGFQVHQVKEKFGTLRFYWAGRDYDAGEAAVADAETESARTCERCGSSGSLRTRNGWLRTLCDDCTHPDRYENLPRDKEE